MQLLDYLFYDTVFCWFICECIEIMKQYPIEKPSKHSTAERSLCSCMQKPYPPPHPSLNLGKGNIILSPSIL